MVQIWLVNPIIKIRTKSFTSPTLPHFSVYDNTLLFQKIKKIHPEVPKENLSQTNGWKDSQKDGSTNRNNFIRPLSAEQRVQKMGKNPLYAKYLTKSEKKFFEKFSIYMPYCVPKSMSTPQFHVILSQKLKNDLVNRILQYSNKINVIMDKVNS